MISAPLDLPAVLHWNLNHFVVLTRITRDLRGHLNRIADIALSKPEASGEGGARDPLTGAIELQGVGFSYGGCN
jgi:hypothetical protein